MEAVAEIATAHGSRYLQQLCKHWSHKEELTVGFDADRGTVIFPATMRGATHAAPGRLEMIATSDRLTVRVAGSSTDQVGQLKAVTASHLDRFAFREAPLPFDWR